MRAALTVFLLLSCAFAADQFGIPKLGMIVGPDGRLLNIQGVPGAATFAPSTDPTQYDRVACATHAQVCVGLAQQQLFLLPTATSIAASGPVLDLEVSPRAAYVAVLTSDSIDLVALNRAIAPVATRIRDLGLVAQPSDFAVSDLGDIVIAGDTTTLTFNPVTNSRAFAALALNTIRFQPKSGRFAAFAPGSGTLVSLLASTLAPDPLPLQLNQPTDIEFSDPTTLWFTQPGQLLKYDLNTATLSRYDLASPEPVIPLGLPGLYLAGPSTLLDVCPATPQLLLIAKQPTQ